MTTISDKIESHFQNAPTKTFSKGKVMLLADQEPPGVWLLIDGLIEQYHISPEGNRVTLNIFKPSAFFPMSWAINKTPNQYVYSALTDVTVKQSDADDTVEFLKTNPDVLFDLLSRVYKGTDGLLKRLAVAASGLASSKLIFTLLIEAYRFGVPVSDGNILVAVKQNDLASRSGLARETVSREIHKLAEDKVIVITKSGLVLNARKLEKALEVTI